MSRRSKRISLPTPGTLADRMQARIARMLDDMEGRDREDSGRPPTAIPAAAGHCEGAVGSPLP